MNAADTAGVSPAPPSPFPTQQEQPEGEQAVKKSSHKKTQDELPSIPQKEPIGATGSGAEFLDFVETYGLFIQTEEGECGLDPELVVNPLSVTIRRVRRAIRELLLENSEDTDP